MSTVANMRHESGRPIQLRRLGDFLARKRAAIKPEDVGIPVPPGRRRRTPGLRREEVAMMAGVGVSWYTWIEQGRAENVSAPVLDGLAHVLRLTANERLYLRRLAGLDSTVAQPDRSVPRDLVEPYPQNWPAGPAYVVDHEWRIAALNEDSRRILHLRRGMNILISAFEDKAVQNAFTDVEAMQENIVSRFRDHASYHPYDRNISSLISGLTARSPTFERLWLKHNIAEDSCGDVEIVIEGEPCLMHWTTLRFTERIGMKFVAYYPVHATVLSAFDSLDEPATPRRGLESIEWSKKTMRRTS